MEVPATCARRSVSPSPPGLGAPQVGGDQGSAVTAVFCGFGDG